MKTFFFLFVMCCCGLNAQVLYPYRVCNSPKELKEFSGLAFTGPGSMAAVNDGGNAAVLYFMDTLGNLTRSRAFSKIVNNDWEELFEAPGGLYIADVGDNLCRRSNIALHYYDLQKDTVTRTINFSFAEKKVKDLPEKDRHYDCEAGFFLNGNIYLFTKTHADPYTGKCFQYTINPADNKHDYTAVDSVSFGTSGFIRNSITGAAASPSGDFVVFISCTRLWLHYRPQEGKFLSTGWSMDFTFDGFTQKEAIAFMPDGKLVVADEKTAGIMGGRIYFYDLPAFFNGKARYAHPSVKNALLKKLKNNLYAFSFESTSVTKELVLVWAGSDGQLIRSQVIKTGDGKVQKEILFETKSKKQPEAFWIVQDNEIIFTSKITQP